jgi:hypothetical protein
MCSPIEQAPLARRPSILCGCNVSMKGKQLVPTASGCVAGTVVAADSRVHSAAKSHRKLALEAR